MLDRDHAIAIVQLTVSIIIDESHRAVAFVVVEIIVSRTRVIGIGHLIVATDFPSMIFARDAVAVGIVNVGGLRFGGDVVLHFSNVLMNQTVEVIVAVVLRPIRIIAERRAMHNVGQPVAVVPGVGRDVGVARVQQAVAVLIDEFRGAVAFVVVEIFIARPGGHLVVAADRVIPVRAIAVGVVVKLSKNKK